MTLPLTYNTPTRDNRLRGKRLAAFILLLIAGALWLAIAALFILSIVSAIVLFSRRGSPLSLPLSAWLIVAAEFAIPVLFTLAYFRSAIGLLRRPRRAAITAIVTAAINAFLPLATITLSIVYILPASNPDDTVPLIILLLLSIATLAYLAILLILLVKVLNPPAAPPAPFTTSLTNSPFAPEVPPTRHL